MSQNPDPRQQLYPQQQPPYPRQYPPLNYGPPYFESYPPPKRDDKKIMTIILIIIIVIFVLPTILAAVLYFVVIGLAPTDFPPPGSQVPIGTWDVTTMSPTTVTIVFGNVNPEPRPMDIEIVLVRNRTAGGAYMFTSNDDGALILTWGEYVGTLTYADLADNQRINLGDELRLTNLHSQSDYIIRLYWVPTGELITSTGFSTPP